MHPVKLRPPKASVAVSAVTQSVPSLPPPVPVVSVVDSAEGKSVGVESVAKEQGKTAKKLKKEKATRREEKKSHTIGCNSQVLNQKADDLLKPSRSTGTKGVVKVPNKKVEGATITRLKPEDKGLVRQDRSLYIGLPRGKSL